MKPRYTLAVLMFLVCLCVLGQRSKIVPIQGQPQTTSKQVTTNQQETIKQLQAENELMKGRLDRMEKEIELYREDVRAKEVAINDNHGHWLTLLSIIIGAIVSILGIGLGVVSPILLNIRNNKKHEEIIESVRTELKTQIESAANDAKSAKDSLSEVTALKESIEAIKKNIDNSKKKAERAAKRAMTSKLFAQAVSEKNSAKAMELYSKILEIEPNIAEVYNNRGILRKDLNDKEGALQDYNKAIELDPNDAGTYNNRGILRKDLNDKEGALQDYNKAIELDPNYAMAYNNRGNLRSDMNDNEGALQDYNKAIELAPNNASKYNNRADLYLKMNDFDKALADVNHSIDLGGGYVSFITKGEIYIAMEKYSDAIELFTQALLYNEKGKESFEYRAKCYRRLAETEPDEEKKAQLIAKAEVDEKKAESLKEVDKA